MAAMRRNRALAKQNTHPGFARQMGTLVTIVVLVALWALLAAHG